MKNTFFLISKINCSFFRFEACLEVELLDGRGELECDAQLERESPDRFAIQSREDDSFVFGEQRHL